MRLPCDYYGMCVCSPSICLTYHKSSAPSATHSNTVQHWKGFISASRVWSIPLLPDYRVKPRSSPHSLLTYAMPRHVTSCHMPRGICQHMPCPVLPCLATSCSLIARIAALPRRKLRGSPYPISWRASAVDPPRADTRSSRMASPPHGGARCGSKCAGSKLHATDPPCHRWPLPIPPLPRSATCCSTFSRCIPTHATFSPSTFSSYLLISHSQPLQRHTESYRVIQSLT